MSIHQANLEQSFSHYRNEPMRETGHIPASWRVKVVTHYPGFESNERKQMLTILFEREEQATCSSIEVPGDPQATI